MPKANPSEVFIRLLADALEADRLIRRAHIAQRSKASATRFRQLFQSDLDHAMHAIQPMGRGRHVTAETPTELRFD